MLSLMRLDRWLLNSLSIVTRPAALELAAEEKLTVSEQEQVAFSFSHDIRRHLKKPAFWVTLEIEALWPEKEKSRFEEIAVCVEGFFSFPPDTPEDDMTKYVPTLCLANLIGIARGLVAQATAFCPGGAFLIPLIDANAIVSSSSKAESAEPSAQKPQSRKKPPKTRTKRTKAEK